MWSKIPVAQLADSTAANGNARGVGAVDWQTSRTGADRVASGTQSVIGGGNHNQASGTQAACAGGNSNTVSGAQASCGGGQLNTVSGQAAAVAGGWGITADSAYSWSPGGQFALTRGHMGRGAWASGRFASTGDAQAGEFVLRCRPTDATPTRLTADAGAAGSANTVNLPNNATYLLRLLVVARQTGGTAGTLGDSAGWSVEALVRRGASVAATLLVGGGGAAIAPAYGDAAAAAWRLAVTADTANGGIAVTATGEANKTIQWVARILSVETVG